MHLGRAGQRAGGESCFEHIHVAHAFFENTLDIADDVHDVAVTLHRKSLGDLDRAGLGDATDVIARQIDQHDVLGALFRVIDQLLLGRLVSFGRGRARPRTSQRADGDFFAVHAVDDGFFLPHQNLRRGPDHMEITEVVVVHVGAGVERAQRAVQRQR